MKITSISAYPRFNLAMQKQPAFGIVKKDARVILEREGVSANTIDKLHADDVLTVKVGDNGLVRATFDKSHPNYWAYEYLDDEHTFLNLTERNRKGRTTADMLAETSLRSVQSSLTLGEGYKSSGIGGVDNKTALQELAESGKI